RRRVAAAVSGRYCRPRAGFRDVGRRGAGRAPRRGAGVQGAAVRARVPRRVLRAGVRRQPRPRRLARHRLRRRRPTPRLHRRRGRQPMTEFDCDAVIVGTGPAGATVAEVLTAAGWSVIMLEKGPNHLLALEPPFGPLGHVSNDELKLMFRHFLGPDPFLEPRTFRRRAAEGDRIFTGGVNNLPSTVGGGGFHADGKLPRFGEGDFRARSELGPIEGADIVDWPVDYDEMEPHYAEAERVVGVAGDHTANPFAAWRSGPYPMPPGPDMYCAVLTAAAGTRLGYHPYRPA